MGWQNYHLLEALLAVEREGHCELAAQSLDTTVEDLLHRPKGDVLFDTHDDAPYQFRVGARESYGTTPSTGIV